MSKNCHDKKKLILNATEDMVAKEGFHGLSMQKLAKEAGVSAGTIYRYFDDKEDLIEATRLHVMQRTADIIQADIHDGMPLKEKYRALWLNIWHFYQTRSAVQSYMLYEQLVSKSEIRCFEKEKEIFHIIESMFNEGKSTQRFKPLDNRVLFSISLESSSTLARKQKHNCIQINDDVIELAINASWDALINH